jgi:enoyl-CoA hydratase/carnithine racemase
VTQPQWVPDDLEAVSFEWREPGIAWIRLNRPDAANARNQRMRRELLALYAAIAADPDVRVVVLGAAGERHFCAGMDLKEAGGPETLAQQKTRLSQGRDIDILASLPVPTIAAVNGAAMGGGFEMALACDIRVVADTARIALPEVKIGLVPGGGATQRLPLVVGYARAAEMILLGDVLTGPEIVDAGLARRSVPVGDLDDAVAEVATAIAEKPPAAVRAAKELLGASQRLPLDAGLGKELDTLLMLLQQRRDGA